MSQLISIGQLIDQSWEHYRNKLRELIEVSVWLLIPGLLSIFSIALQPGISLETNITLTWWQWVGVIIGNLNNFIVAPVIGLWVFIFLVKVIAAQREKKSESLSTLSKTSWHFFLPTIFINLLVVLCIFLTWFLAIPGIVVNWLGLVLNLNPLLVIGAILLSAGVIAAGILTFCFIFDFTFAPFLLITENEHGKKSLIKSRELISGRFWSTVLRIIVPKGAFLAIVLVIEIILDFILRQLALTASGLNIELLTKLEIIGLLLSLAVGSVFLTPLLTLIDFILFKSLRESKK